MTATRLLNDKNGLDEKLLLYGNDSASEDHRSEEEKRLSGIIKMLSTFITACGNFSVQYNFQSISIALLIMSASQCTIDDDECKEGEQASWVFSTASASVFVGAIMGQLTMGYAGDVFGRNSAMMFTLALVFVSALLSALAPTGSATQVYLTIIIARFFLGVGVGGVYPLSATKAAEDGGGGHGGDVDIHAASWAFFWQVPGSMTPWIVANIFTNTDLSNDTQWRLLLGLGALPAAVVVACTYTETVLRDQMHDLEVKRLESSGNSNSVQTNNGLPPKKRRHQRNEVDMWELLRDVEIWKKLAATGGGWLIYDIAYYGVSLFAGEIIEEISDSDDDNVSSMDSIRHVTTQNLIGLSMAIPAMLLSIVLLKYMSTKTLQIIGFLLIAVMFTLLASTFVPLRDGYGDVLFTLYCLLLFSLSFGPNLTTFILPAQTYPKDIRATFNGISAACGKVGAFTGVYMFGSIAEATSYPTVMAICAVFSVLGAIVSYFFIDYCPPRRRFSSSSAGDDEGSDVR